MKISEVISKLQLTAYTRMPGGEELINNVYVSDLLSDVMANAHEKGIWITLQTHINVVAVAAMKNIPAVIIVNGRKPDDDTLKKATDEGVAILGTDMHAFEAAGILYNMLNG
ncbi:MAG: serine kinase [Nitrospirota bacterium]|nr:MAG: serine kinase [Nitrospirota bacterium]